MEKKKEVIFEFSIRSVTDSSGNTTLHPAVVNDGVPDEYIVAMLRMMLKGFEELYFEKFKQKF